MGAVKDFEIFQIQQKSRLLQISFASFQELKSKSQGMKLERQ